MRSLNLRSQAALKCTSNRAPRKQTNYTGNDELNRSSVTPETTTEGALISFTRRIISRSRGCHFVPCHQLQPTAPSPNHVLCRMLLRAAGPTPEGNLTDNPGGKTKPSYQLRGIFLLNKFFLLLHRLQKWSNTSSLGKEEWGSQITTSWHL